MFYSGLCIVWSSNVSNDKKYKMEKYVGRPSSGFQCITARKRNCKKVMFSLVFVCLGGGSDWAIYIGGSAWSGVLHPGVLHPGGYLRGICLEGCGLADHPRVKWDTVNERAVRILLECILVVNVICSVNKTLFFLFCRRRLRGGALRS